MILVFKNRQLIRVDGKSKYDVVAISVEESQTVSGLTLPKITAEQMQLAYNYLVAGVMVVIASENGEYFVVNQANSDSDKLTLYYSYKDSHIIKNVLDGSSVVITAKEYGTGGGGGAVDSVNGQTGDVVLTATDIKIQSDDVRNIKTVLDFAFEEITRVEGLVGTEETRAKDVEEDLQDQITNLSSRGRYLSNWNSITGLPITNPTTELPYEYRQGDYFIVGTAEYNQYVIDRTYNTGDKVKHNGLYYECLEDGVSGIFDESKWNEIELVIYRPDGTEYDGTASEVVETKAVAIGDSYVYDGTQWVYQKNAPIDLSEYEKSAHASTTYATKTEVSAKANDNAVVHLTGEETITGEKIIPTVQLNVVKENVYQTIVLQIGSAALTARVNIVPYYQKSNQIDLGTPSQYWRNLYLRGKLDDGTNSITVAQIAQKTDTILNTTDTTFAGSLSSNKEYQFTQSMTSISIASLEVQAGDNNPVWSLTFVAGASCSVSLPAGVKWVNNTTPTYTQGKTYKIMVSKFGSDYLAVAGEF